MTARKSKSGWGSAGVESGHVHTTVVGNQYVVVRHSHAWSPPTDIFEDEQALVVLIEISGMNRGEFNVILKERSLTISGERPAPHDASVAFHQIEVRHGQFRVDVELPWTVDQADVEAHYEDGFLRVSLPRAKATSVHIVDVAKTDQTDE